MLFPSTIFLFVFLPLLLIFYYHKAFSNRTLRNIILLAASLLFYAWGEPWFVLVMLGSIVINWLLGLLSNLCKPSKIKSRIVIALMLIINLSLLFVFKYLNFTLENIALLSGQAFTSMNIILPLGISFFTFRSISYVVDVSRGKGTAQKNLLNVALYISFFPQIMAGPIASYESFENQIHKRNETFEAFSSGVCRFIYGLGKKVLISNALAPVADFAFSAEAAERSVLLAWVGILAYTFQIFFDFSGYSDMAIGLGKMFGFDFPENFNYPYISQSITEFWRRWHISLGTWFKDYLYFPLGGSRVKSKMRLIFNLFAVWFITGLWHGANLTFILWGLLYFVLLVIEKLTGWTEKLNFKPLKIFYTLFFVVIGWVFFRSPSISFAFEYIQSLFGFVKNALWDATGLMYLLDNKVIFIAAVLLSTPIFPYLGKKLDNLKNPVKLINFTYFSIYTVSLMLILVLVILNLAKDTHNPFIYLNF